MKKILSLLLLILIGCSSEPINYDEMLINRDGRFYTKDTNEPYTGPVFSLFKDGGFDQEFSLVNGYVNGSYKRYWEDEEVDGWGPNRLMTEGTYDMGRQVGTWNSFYPDGDTLRVEIFDENGKVIEHGFFEDGVRSKTNRYR